MLPKQTDLLLFRFTLVLLGYGDDEVGDAVEVSDSLVIGMVGDDERNLAAQFAAVVTVEQILQAVIVPGNEDGDARTLGSVGDSPVHFEVPGYRSEAAGKLGEIEGEVCRVEFDACQKEIRFFVSVLIGEEDVAVVPKNEIGNGSDDAFPVRAGD